MNAFTLKDIQNAIALIGYHENRGVTDVRFCRERLYNEAHRRAKNPKKMSNRARIKARELKKEMREKLASEGKVLNNQEKCPECGSRQWYPVEREGVEYMGCRKCRYSKLIGGE